jgi:DNA-binding MarR family transcriptional regulator
VSYSGRMSKVVGEGMGVVTALVRSSFLVNAVYAQAGRAYGLTSQQGQLLCVLMAQPYGMSELGEMLGQAKSSLTGLVDRTAHRGLVKREPDPRDGRAVRVALTAEGSELADEFYAETCRRIELLPAGLSDADRGKLAELLGRVVRDNKVPEVFLELAEDAPAARGH